MKPVANPETLILGFQPNHPNFRNSPLLSTTLVRLAIVSAIRTFRCSIGASNPRISVKMLDKPLDRVTHRDVERRKLELVPKKGQ